MSDLSLQSIEQRVPPNAPDLIYVPNNCSVYFTRPKPATASPSDSVLYGYDPLTNLPQYDLQRELPPGTVLRELARGVYAGWHVKPWKRQWERWGASDYLPPITHQQSTTLVGSSHDQTYGNYQQDSRSPEFLNPRLWKMFSPDNPDSRRKSRITSDSVRTGRHHRGGPPRASSPRDRIKPVHPRVPSYISGEMTNHPLPAYKALMDGLNQCYSNDLKADLGHRFDDVDDDVIIAYAKAHVSLFGRPYPELLATMTVGEEANQGRHPSCLIPVPYLGIRYKYLDVILPLSRDYVRDLDNDVLRLLHVHLAAFDCGAPDNVPMRASHADLAESRHQVLCELHRRGFTERLPNIVRLKGLGASARTAGVEEQLGPRSTLRPRPSVLATQSQKPTQTSAAGRARVSTNDPHVESRPSIRQQPQSSRSCGSNATSLINKGQAPTEYVNGRKSCAPSQGILTPSTPVQAVHAESVSELDLSHSTKGTPQEGLRTKSEAEALYDKEGPESYITFGNPERILNRKIFTRATSEVANRYHKEDPGSMYGVASEPRTLSNSPNDRPRDHVRRGLDVPQKRRSGEPSPAKKRKSLVEDIQDVEMSDQSEGVITPSISVQTVHEQSALDPSDYMSVRQACESRALREESTVDESDLPYTSRDSVPESYMTMTDDLFRFMLRK